MDMKKQIYDYIVENFLFGSTDGIKLSQPLLESGVIDSTGVMELVMFLEQRFRIKVADEELVPENLNTIDNISNYVELKLAGSSTVTDQQRG